jgi:hypothetical protein
MSSADSGHNATIAVELGTPPVSGVWTNIPELMGDLKGFSGTRAVTKFTPHGENINSAVTGPIERNSSSFTLNFDPNDATHLALRAAFFAPLKVNRLRGWRYWGPAGSAGVDEVIQSGEIVEWDDTAPEGAGIRQVAVMVEFSKQAKIDGVLHGTAA